jgi:hypothetical protein
MHDLCKGFGALLSRSKVRRIFPYIREKQASLLFLGQALEMSLVPSAMTKGDLCALKKLF